MAVIDVDSIQFSYDGGTPVIKNLSCLFQPGRFYSILGPNGSGKTTLLDLIIGFLKPSAGSIRINDRSLTDLSRQFISTTMALVSQDYAVNFPFPVKEVIMMGRHPHIPRFTRPSMNDIDRVEKALDICGIRHLKHKKVNTLSGGERQRCVFARALCQDTPILLLDEAFSNMDISHTLHLLKLIKQEAIQKNRTVISVFHDLNLASIWADELILLKKGEIFAMGDCQDTLTPATIKSVFSVDAIVTLNPDTNRKQVTYPAA